jgi:hypothetical protein
MREAHEEAAGLERLVAFKRFLLECIATLLRSALQGCLQEMLRESFELPRALLRVAQQERDVLERLRAAGSCAGGNESERLRWLIFDLRLLKSWLAGPEEQPPPCHDLLYLLQLIREHMLPALGSLSRGAGFVQHAALSKADAVLRRLFLSLRERVRCSDMSDVLRACLSQFFEVVWALLEQLAEPAKHGRFVAALLGAIGELTADTFFRHGETCWRGVLTPARLSIVASFAGLVCEGMTFDGDAGLCWVDKWLVHRQGPEPEPGPRDRAFARAEDTCYYSSDRIRVLWCLLWHTELAECCRQSAAATCLLDALFDTIFAFCTRPVLCSEQHRLGISFLCRLLYLADDTVATGLLRRGMLDLLFRCAHTLLCDGIRSHGIITLRNCMERDEGDAAGAPFRRFTNVLDLAGCIRYLVLTYETEGADGKPAWPSLTDHETAAAVLARVLLLNWMYPSDWIKFLLRPDVLNWMSALPFEEKQQLLEFESLRRHAELRRALDEEDSVWSCGRPVDDGDWMRQLLLRKVGRSNPSPISNNSDNGHGNGQKRAPSREGGATCSAKRRNLEPVA